MAWGRGRRCWAEDGQSSGAGTDVSLGNSPGLVTGKGFSPPPPAQLSLLALSFRFHCSSSKGNPCKYARHVRPALGLLLRGQEIPRGDSGCGAGGLGALLRGDESPGAADGGS